MHVAPLFYIYTAISNLLTNSCIRKYAELEELMCLGCHPYESSYIDRGKRVVSLYLQCICDEDVECIELSSGSRKYDNCGFKITPFLAKAVKPSRHYIIPSETFTGFLHMVTSIGIPFYEDYEIQLVDEQQENATTCFNNSNLIIVSFMFYIYSLLLL